MATGCHICSERGDCEWIIPAQAFTHFGCADTKEWVRRLPIRPIFEAHGMDIWSVYLDILADSVTRQRGEHAWWRKGRASEAFLVKVSLAVQFAFAYQPNE